MPAHSARERSTERNAARLVRVAFSLWLSLITLGCRPMGTVGVYSDAGVRCDPLATTCGGAMACSLRADPTMDACRDVEGVLEGQACDSPDACEAGSQCVAIGADGASLEPSALASGRCARICARDAPACATGEHCIAVLAAAGGVRIDYGVCGR